METEAFVERIISSTAHRPVRDALAALALDDLQLWDCLIGKALDVTFPEHFKACWIAEIVLEHKLFLLQPYLPQFCAQLPQFDNESALRSISKICWFTTIREHKKGDFLTAAQAQTLSENCMDWLISDAKVATKAYAMRALRELGRTQAWIFPELRAVLLQGFPLHSAGYKAAAKDVLRQIS